MQGVMRGNPISALERACGVLAVIVGLMLPAVVTSAAEPELVLPAQGVLRSTSGGPVEDGKYVMTFSLYTEKSGGSALWTEVHPVIAVTGGSFHVGLGSWQVAKKSLAEAGLAWSKPLWLGVKVSDDPELARVSLGLVARAVWANTAGVADTLKGTLDGKQLSVGWPWAVARPGLPQIRACAIDALGSSAT